MSLSDFDQQPPSDASTINNKHYQFHHDYDESLFNSNNGGNENTDAMQSALNRGPYFDISASRNVTALVGTTAYLNCRVKNLGNKTVCRLDFVLSCCMLHTSGCGAKNLSIFKVFFCVSWR